VRLLVSVRDAAEARDAAAAGADIVDVKEPAGGTLAPAAPGALAAIAGAVPAAWPLGVALGEPEGGAALAGLLAARRDALAGREVYLKFVAPVGLEAALVAIAREQVPGARIVLAGYADRPGTAAARTARVRAAGAAGADGILLDTLDKSRTLLDIVGDGELEALARLADGAGCLLALAGSLGAAELPRVARAGAAVAGVRGAACEGGRDGRLSPARVAALVAAARRAPRAHGAPA
jgi:uncharacterized protein (UPF0264 family)